MGFFVLVLAVTVPAMVFIWACRAIDPEFVDDAFGWKARKEDYWVDATRIEQAHERVLQDRREGRSNG